MSTIGYKIVSLEYIIFNMPIILKIEIPKQATIVESKYSLLKRTNIVKPVAFIIPKLLGIIYHQTKPGETIRIYSSKLFKSNIFNSKRLEHELAFGYINKNVVFKSRYAPMICGSSLDYKLDKVTSIPIGMLDIGEKVCSSGISYYDTYEACILHINKYETKSI